MDRDRGKATSDRLEHETLGKPTALAVFASDNLSSCAYATEEILRVLIPFVGLAAFSLVTPVTVALLVVLGFLILSLLSFGVIVVTEPQRLFGRLDRTTPH